MKKFIFILTILFGLSLFLVSCYKEQQEVRIRIVANDNTEFAQKEKMVVKDLILDILNEHKVSSYEEIVPLLKNELKCYNTYSINVEYLDEYFPAKSLNGKIIPSGVYKTIKITLGKGLGENWWSILYPEFFGVSHDKTDNIEYQSYFYQLIFGYSVK